MQRRGFLKSTSVLSTAAFAPGFLSNDILLGKNLPDTKVNNSEISRNDISIYRKKN